MLEWEKQQLPEPGWTRDEAAAMPASRRRRQEPEAVSARCATGSMAHQHHFAYKRSHHKDRTQSRIVLAVLQVALLRVTTRHLGALGLVLSPARAKTWRMSGVLNVSWKYRTRIILFCPHHYTPP